MTRPAFCPVKPREYGSPKACIGELFRQCGGLKTVMELLGLKSESTAYALTDPAEKAEISFSRVVMLSRRGASAAAEYLAQICGGVFLPLTPDTDNLNKLCAEDVRAHGEAIASIVNALHDGKWTKPEKDEALQKLDAALRSLTGLRAGIVGEETTPPA